MITNYEVTSKGIRVNPNLRRQDDIFVQIAAHRAKSRKTTKQHIEDILDS